MCTCGSEAFERVAVSRPDAKPYVTEFVACAHCRVMYYRPRERERVIHFGRPFFGAFNSRAGTFVVGHPEGPDVDDWASRYRKSVRK